MADYVTDTNGWSIGAEIALHPVKLACGGTSVTPFGLLGAAAMWGDAEAAARWWEYERVMTGKLPIQASPELAERYGVEQVDDDEAAAPEAVEVVAEVEVDPCDWLLLSEYHATDRFVMAVEEWAATGAVGRPPDARAHVLEVVTERRQCAKVP